jgi:hypothetical protein
MAAGIENGWRAFIVDLRTLHATPPWMVGTVLAIGIFVAVAVALHTIRPGLRHKAFCPPPSPSTVEAVEEDLELVESALAEAREQLRKPSTRPVENAPATRAAKRRKGRAAARAKAKIPANV